MNKLEYYAGELNILCVGICLLIVVTYWIQTLSPELYAVIKVLLESADPFYMFKGEINPENPTDFVQLI